MSPFLRLYGNIFYYEPGAAAMDGAPYMTYNAHPACVGIKVQDALFHNSNSGRYPIDAGEDGSGCDNAPGPSGVGGPVEYNRITSIGDAAQPALDPSIAL